MPKGRNSIALAMELCLFYIKRSIFLETHWEHKLTLFTKFLQ